MKEMNCKYCKRKIPNSKWITIKGCKYCDTNYHMNYKIFEKEYFKMINKRLANLDTQK